MRPKVVLDTNMLLVPFQFGVDIFEEIERILPGAEVYVTENVLKELERIGKQSTKLKKMTNLAKKLIKIRDVVVIQTPKGEAVDTTLARLAREGFIVATNDKELKRKVWAVGGKVLTLRERSHLELT